MRWLPLAIVLIASPAFAAPSITGNSGTLSHGQAFTVTGSGFGSKSAAAPVAFGDMENNSLNARIGSWTATGSPPGLMTVSTAHQRNAHSTYNSVCNITNTDNLLCAFEGGSDSPTWFVQNWFYGDPADFTWSGGDGNNKIFRMWSTGSDTNNLRVQGPINHVDVVVEDADVNHGGYYSGGCPPSPSGGWYPVVPGGVCTDAIFGHSCNCTDWLGGSVEWRNFSTDMGTGTWHLFQFEMQSSDIDTANGVLRWWVDGKLVFNHSDIITRTSTNPSHMRPKYVGIEPIHNVGGNGALGHYYLDDVYIDNTWQRVEIGNNATYNNCTLREIQSPTAWGDASITFTVNQGSFADNATGYVFVTDANGTRNTGYTVTFGAGSPASLPGHWAKGRGAFIFR